MKTFTPGDLVSFNMWWIVRDIDTLREWQKGGTSTLIREEDKLYLRRALERARVLVSVVECSPRAVLVLSTKGLGYADPEWLQEL